MSQFVVEDVVEYTAPCPNCSEDVLWRSTVRETYPHHPLAWWLLSRASIEPKIERELEIICSC